MHTVTGGSSNAMACQVPGDETLVASTVVLHSFDRMRQESTNKQSVPCTALHYKCTYQFYSAKHETVTRKLTLIDPLLPEAAAVALTCAPVALPACCPNPPVHVELHAPCLCLQGLPSQRLPSRRLP
jgi:hypothetical protein